MLLQLPQATSSATRSTNLFRSPLGSSFRKYSDDADKKVRGPVIGIDLGMFCPLVIYQHLMACSHSFLTGTTNSAVAIMEGPAAKIIENSEG